MPRYVMSCKILYFCMNWLVKGMKGHVLIQETRLVTVSCILHILVKCVVDFRSEHPLSL